MIKIANVLVATDFGPAADSALAYGREFARMFDARLHVLHVVENPMVYRGVRKRWVWISRACRLTWKPERSRCSTEL